MTAVTVVTAPPTARYRSVDDLLAEARAGLDRLRPAEALAAVLTGARLVDIRPAWQREREGEIPGSLVVERNHLEWRLHPGSGGSLPHARHAQQWVVVCSEGYTSSLAAAALRSLGLAATDLDGGFHAWAAAGLPVTDPGHATGVERIVPGAVRLLEARLLAA